MLKAFQVAVMNTEMIRGARKGHVIFGMLLSHQTPHITLQNFSSHSKDIFFPEDQPYNISSVRYVREIPLNHVKVTDLSVAQLLQLITSQGGNTL